MIGVGDRVLVSGWVEGCRTDVLVIDEAGPERLVVQPPDFCTPCVVRRDRCELLPGGQMLASHACAISGPTLLWRFGQVAEVAP